MNPLLANLNCAPKHVAMPICATWLRHAAIKMTLVMGS